MRGRWRWWGSEEEGEVWLWKRRRSCNSLLLMGSLELELFGRLMLMLCDVYAGGKSLFSPFWKWYFPSSRIPSVPFRRYLRLPVIPILSVTDHLCNSVLSVTRTSSLFHVFVYLKEGTDFVQGVEKIRGRLKKQRQCLLPGTTGVI